VRRDKRRVIVKYENYFRPDRALAAQDTTTYDNDLRGKVRTLRIKRYLLVYDRGVKRPFARHGAHAYEEFNR